MQKNENRNPGISRRRFLARATATGAVAALPCWTWGSETAATSKRPNLILILTDDQRADSLSCAGNAILKTPHIDSLAERGVRFTNSFTTTAICGASRASILTGLHTRCHGLGPIQSIEKPLAPALWRDSYPMLLRRAGYRTGFVGKWGLGGPLPEGDYDYFAGYSGQGDYFEPGQKKHLTVRQGDHAVEFLHSCSAAQPFCLAVSFKAPHVQDDGRILPGIYPKYPYDLAQAPLFTNQVIPPPVGRDITPPPAFLNQTFNRLREGPDFFPEHYQETMKDLYRLLTGVDMAVGRMLEPLRQNGMDQNTVIIYSADHGSFYGEHGFGGKWLMYEPSIRTPMIVCDPRLPANRRGAVREEMALNIDIPATLLESAQVAAPPGMQGRSLMPLVRGRMIAWRDEWFYEHAPGPGVRSIVALAASQGVRTRRWKYIRYVDPSPMCEQLFDLRADPHEENDLAGQARFADVMEDMRARRRNWLSGLNNWRPENRWSEPWALTESPI